MIFPFKTLLSLGVVLLLPQLIFAAPTKPLPTGEGPPTIIDSDHLEMTTLEEETRFIFSNNVKVTTTDMTLFCDRLEVYAGRKEAKKTEEGAESELGRIQKIFAIGNVRILQEDREATSGRAEVFPQKGLIELTENPVVRDAQGQVSGERITFFQGERRAVVDGGEDQPVRVTLPTVPALGGSAEKLNRENDRPIN